MLLRIFIVLLLCSGAVTAQEFQDISKWDIQVSKVSPAAGEQVEVVFSAAIDKNWKLYSSDFKGDIGPLPTEFSFAGSDAYQLVGDVRAIKPLKTVDPTWDKAYTYFVEKAEFRQTIKLVKKDFVIEGTIKGLLCSNKDGLCVPFKEFFKVQ
jgi:hypothetical protein